MGDTRVYTYNLFLRILIRRQQINSLHMSEINVMTKEENEQQLAHIFLFLISIECLVPFKFTANVR